MKCAYCLESDFCATTSVTAISQTTASAEGRMGQTLTTMTPELRQRSVQRAQKALQIRSTHQFVDLRSQFVFLLHHGNYLLLHDCSHVHIHWLRLSGHVTNHLVVGEDTVPAQLSVMRHAVAANRHLREIREETVNMYKYRFWVGYSAS